jgi:hypothetical protein
MPRVRVFGERQRAVNARAASAGTRRPAPPGIPSAKVKPRVATTRTAPSASSVTGLEDRSRRLRFELRPSTIEPLATGREHR